MVGVALVIGLMYDPPLDDTIKDWRCVDGLMIFGVVVNIELLYNPILLTGVVDWKHIDDLTIVGLDAVLRFMYGLSLDNDIKTCRHIDWSVTSRAAMVMGLYNAPLVDIIDCSAITRSYVVLRLMYGLPLDDAIED